MSKKKRSEAGQFVVFCQTQPVELVRGVLDICNEVLAARTPKVDKPVKASGRKTKKVEGEIQMPRTVPTIVG